MPGCGNELPVLVRNGPILSCTQRRIFSAAFAYRFITAAGGQVGSRHSPFKRGSVSSNLTRRTKFLAA